MEYEATRIIKYLQGALKWCEKDKDTMLYREIQVLIRQLEIDEEHDY